MKVTVPNRIWLHAYLPPLQAKSVKAHTSSFGSNNLKVARWNMARTEFASCDGSMSAIRETQVERMG